MTTEVAIGGAKLAAKGVKAAINRAKGKKTAAKGKDKPKRRRHRLLTLAQREELMWISRHLGRTAAAERMMHYRR